MNEAPVEVVTEPVNNLSIQTRKPATEKEVTLLKHQEEMGLRPEPYRISEEDVVAVGEGLDFLWSPEMDKVFGSSEVREDLVAVIYDSEGVRIFLPQTDKTWKVEKVDVDIELKERSMQGWVAALDRDIEPFLKNL